METALNEFSRTVVLVGDENQQMHITKPSFTFRVASPDSDSDTNQEVQDDEALKTPSATLLKSENLTS
eukprot:1776116-Amphidinium_carterae.1